MAWSVKITDVAGLLFEGEVEGSNVDEALMEAIPNAELDQLDEGSFTIEISGAA